MRGVTAVRNPQLTNNITLLWMGGWLQSKICSSSTAVNPLPACKATLSRTLRYLFPHIPVQSTGLLLVYIYHWIMFFSIEACKVDIMNDSNCIGKQPVVKQPVTTHKTIYLSACLQMYLTIRNKFQYRCTQHSMWHLLYFTNTMHLVMISDDSYKQWCFPSFWLALSIHLVQSVCARTHWNPIPCFGAVCSYFPSIWIAIQFVFTEQDWI